MMPVRPREVSIRVQIIALLIVTQLLATTVSIVGVRFGAYGLAPPVPDSVAREMLEPLTTVLRLTRALNEPEEALFSAIVRVDPRFAFEDEVVAVAPDEQSMPMSIALRQLQPVMSQWPKGRVIIAKAELFSMWPLNAGNFKVAVRLDHGGWLTYTPPRDAIARALPILLMVLVLTALAAPIAAFVIWVGGTLVAPLRRLANAAERFSLDLDAAPAEVSGPAEVRTVARTFNAMRQRIKALVDSRTYTLAAVGHDLRTPLTRMRLRLEGQEATDRAALLRDVRSMEVMVESGLAFLRGQDHELSIQRFDLAALVQTLVDERVDRGEPVTSAGEHRLVVEADSDLLRRALDNLLDNAVAYAGPVVVRVAVTDGGEWAAITFTDEGPGVPAAIREGLLEPFRRGDPARGRGNETGLGLGLSIAREVAERHGGTLTLADNEPKGLKVELALPLRAEGVARPDPAAIAMPQRK